MTLRPSLRVQAQVTLPQPLGGKPDRALEAAAACLPGHLGGWPELRPTRERIPSHPREDTVPWPCLASGAGLREGRAGAFWKEVDSGAVDKLEEARPLGDKSSPVGPEPARPTGHTAGAPQWDKWAGSAGLSGEG